MGKGFGMKMRGGNLNPGRLLEIVRGPVQRAGLVVQGGVMESSPKKEGTLQRSWTTAPAQVMGKRVVSRVGTRTVYARYQNERTRNRGYVKRGIDATKAHARQVLVSELHTVLSDLWEKGK